MLILDKYKNSTISVNGRMKRRKTREVRIGKVRIGNNNPIAVQSMANTITKDADQTIKQVHSLEELGCEIVRVSVPDMDSVNALKKIRENISIPLVADIHFDYRLAVESAKYADKLRINPGNIGNDERVKLVADAARQHGIPIRIGVNLGSLEKELEKKFGLTPKAMMESARKNIEALEKLNFTDIVVALKASDVIKTIEAYRCFSAEYDYPVHLGVTEAGGGMAGIVNSSVGIGSLLLDGIGDTIRVSLSDRPEEEVKAAWQILRALKIRKRGVEITSCPTCARANIDVITIVRELTEKTACMSKDSHVAVMGCAVNGPGEATQADFGIVGAKDSSLLYKNGKLTGRISKSEIISRLLEELK